MNSRTINFIIVGILTLSFIASLYNIKNVTKENDKERKKDLGRFVLPTIAMTTFFVSCYFISLIISEGEITGRDKYAGILFMGFVGIILTFANFSVLAKDKLDEYVKGKKFSVIGLFMALGVSAIVFGFLDNFGMKLGTEALDDTFLQVFLSPFSTDKRFVDYKDNIQENLKIINEWTSGDWRKLLNQVLRFEDDIAKIDKFKAISNAIKGLNSRKLQIPESILKSKEMTNDYVDNLRDKYDIIDGSKAMLGNTFSDFIGAILGAALINLFIYMTNYDGFITGDDNIDENFFVKHLSYYAPFMEAIFIALGCLVPVFLNIAMNRRSNKKNNMYSWLIVGIIGIVMIIMMYLSSKGVSKMTYNDKKLSVKKNVEAVKERIDLDNQDPDESKLGVYIDAFLESLNNININEN